MRIVLTFALFELEPLDSIKRTYIKCLVNSLSKGGHELCLVTSHWGGGTKRSLSTTDFDTDTAGLNVWSFPVPVTNEKLEFLSGTTLASLTERKKTSSLSKFEERLFVEMSGYTEAALDFIREHEDTIDLCIFISMTDPFSLLGSVAFNKKSLLIPLAFDLDWRRLAYSERALAHVAAVGCSTPGELRYFSQEWQSRYRAKCFLLGLPSTEAFTDEFVQQGDTTFSSSLLPVELSQDTPLSMDVLRAFSNHRAIVSPASCKSIAADITQSFGGWLTDAPNESLDPEVHSATMTAAQINLRGENAWIYYQWLSQSTNFNLRLVQNCLRSNFGSMSKFFGKKVIIAYRAISALDAVGYDIIQQRAEFAACGAEVKISCEICDNDQDLYRASPAFLSEVLRDPQAFLIYHLAINWPEFEDLIVTARCQRIAKYHNITPMEFFLPYSVELARESQIARSNLKVLVEAQQFDAYWADSEFNQSELLRFGANPAVCSIVKPHHKASMIAYAQLSPQWIPKRENQIFKILCVGRIAPNKGHKDLVAAVAQYIRLYDRNIEVYIVGASDPSLKGYLQEIQLQLLELGLDDIVQLCGRLAHNEVATLYQSCDALVMLSQHEGFCVPVIEAQISLLPVIAYRTSALVETVANKDALCDVGDFYAVAMKLRAIKSGHSLQT